MRIKELRLEKDLNQAQLGKLLGFSQRAVSDWELGTREPNIDTLIKMSDFFDVSVDYLIGRVPDKNNNDIENLLLTYKCLSKNGQEDVIQYAKLIEDRESAEK